MKSVETLIFILSVVMTNVILLIKMSHGIQSTIYNFQSNIFGLSILEKVVFIL